MKIPAAPEKPAAIVGSIRGSGTRDGTHLPRPFYVTHSSKDTSIQH